MSDQNQDLVIQEVDDELRRESVNALWKAYGKYLIAAAVAVVLIVAGREIYTSQTATIESERSEAYEALQKEAADLTADLGAVFRAYDGRLGDTYKKLARLYLGGLALERGQLSTALAFYSDLENGAEAGDAMGDLASLLGALVFLDSGGDPAEARGRLQAIARPDSTYYYTVLEQIAHIDLKLGDVESARQRLATLSSDIGTPLSIRARVDEMLDAMEETAPVISEAEPAPSDAEAGDSPAGEDLAGGGDAAVESLEEGEKAGETAE